MADAANRAHSANQHPIKGTIISTNWTETDIPDQTDKVILITGANSGIGYEAARALAAKGAHVVLACRNRSKAEGAAGKITATNPTGSVEVLEMDLADLDSVERAAKEFLGNHDHLDLLVNNAGVMAIPFRQTVQGFEMQFGVNHLGHFALTAHLLPSLMSAPGSRVVSISSQGHRPGKVNFDDLNSKTSYSAWPAYFQSKLANLLFTRELGRRLAAADADVIAVAAHPGASDTNLGHESSGGIIGTITQLLMPLLSRVASQSAAMGALPTLRAATEPGLTSGDYFGPDGFGEQKGHPVKVGMSDRARDDATARRLWDVSEELTGVRYDGI